MTLDPAKNIVLSRADAARFWNKRKKYTPPLFGDIGEPKSDNRDRFHDWRDVLVARKALWHARKHGGLPPQVMHNKSITDVLADWNIGWKPVDVGNGRGKYQIDDNPSVPTTGVEDRDEPNWSVYFMWE